MRFCLQDYLSRAGGRTAKNGPPNWVLCSKVQVPAEEPLPNYLSEMPNSVWAAINDLETGGCGFSNAGARPAPRTETPSRTCTLHQPLPPSISLHYLRSPSTDSRFKGTLNPAHT